jgi:hypothetical protein
MNTSWRLEEQLTWAYVKEEYCAPTYIKWEAAMLRRNRSTLIGHSRIFSIRLL